MVLSQNFSLCDSTENNRLWEKSVLDFLFFSKYNLNFHPENAVGPPAAKRMQETGSDLREQ